MRKVLIFSIVALVLIGLGLVIGYQYYATEVPPPAPAPDTIKAPPPPPLPTEARFTDEKGQPYDIRILNASFLHNEKRNYYGDRAPSKLDIIWKHHLGTGTTRVNGIVHWSGAGWTGQPLMVIENGHKFIIQGAYDHHLKKIDAETGKLVWQYKYDDVIKGTGTLWINHRADSLKHRCVVLQGSRSGGGLDSKNVFSYRAVSYFTGEELWRLNSVRTRCYSRDVDGSALIVNDTAYLGLENGIFHVFDPEPRRATPRDGYLQPFIYDNSDTLFLKNDASLHGGNLVTEASPVRLGNRIYVASGSGHVWGYNLQTKTIDWDYYIGSDIDGSPVVTDDGCLLISVEKQYIKGKGGLLKINPALPPDKAGVWYFPTGDRSFASWLGGIIGTATVNDAYCTGNEPRIAAFTAIDGFMYVVDTRNTEPQPVKIFDGVRELPCPRLVFKYSTGPAIATPLIVGNKLVVAGYDGVFLFEYNDRLEFKLLAKQDMGCEATPFVDNGRIYVASRDGNLYCMGE